MADNNLKEYLIKLGFDVDNASRQKMLSAVREGTFQANVLFEALSKAVTTFGSAMFKAADQLNNLYWESTRIKETVGNIQAFEAAAAQTGSTAEEAEGALTSFFKAIRFNPGLDQLARSYTHVSAAQWKMLGTSQKLEATVKGMRNLPPWVQNAYFDMLGIPFNLREAILSGEFDKHLERLKDMQKRADLDPQQAADDAHKFINAYEDFGNALMIIGEKIEDKLVKHGGLKEFHDFNDYLIEHSSEISGALADIGNGIVNVAKAVVENLPKADKWVHDHLGKDGWTKIFETLVVLTGVRLVGAIGLATNALRVMLALGAGTPLGIAIETLVAMLTLIPGLLDQFNKAHGINRGQVGLHSPYNNAPGGAWGDWGSFGDLNAPGGLHNPNAPSAPDNRTLWERRPTWMGGKPPPMSTTTGGMTRDQTEAYIRQSAINHGIDPNVAVAVARSEGLNKYTGDYGTSFGPFQLHYGGSGIPGMNSRGLGDAFTKDTGLDARNPATVRQQIDYAMEQVRKGGWGPWHGAAHVGIYGYAGVGPMPSQSALSTFLGVTPAQAAEAARRMRSPSGGNPYGDLSGVLGKFPAPANSNTTHNNQSSLNQKTTIHVYASENEEVGSKIAKRQSSINAGLVRDLSSVAVG